MLSYIPYAILLAILYAMRIEYSLDYVWFSKKLNAFKKQTWLINTWIPYKHVIFKGTTQRQYYKCLPITRNSSTYTTPALHSINPI